MQDNLFTVETVEENDHHGKYSISPLAQGYGNTIGTTLRRVLLSSLSGSAITYVKINGVRHQFTTLKGMKEDIVELILNLKKVRLNYSGDKPVKAKISVSKEGEVKASDIETDSSVTIVNPEITLAYLNKGAKLEVSLVIEKGTGYSPADDRKTDEIGLIPVDAVFSPVKLVNYKVEETRVGGLTNFDNLTIEITTDGSVNPKDALMQASQIVISYFAQIVTPKKVKVEEEEEEKGLGPIGKLSVEEIGLPTRVANALIKTKFETLEQLVKAKRKDLVKVRNLGEKSVKIIEEDLSEKDLKLS